MHVHDACGRDQPDNVHRLVSLPFLRAVIRDNRITRRGRCLISHLQSFWPTGERGHIFHPNQRVMKSVAELSLITDGCSIDVGHCRGQESPLTPRDHLGSMDKAFDTLGKSMHSPKIFLLSWRLRVGQLGETMIKLYYKAIGMSSRVCYTLQR